MKTLLAAALLTIVINIVLDNFANDERFALDSQLCTNAGGIPIRSLFYSARLTDCIFPPYSLDLPEIEEVEKVWML